MRIEQLNQNDIVAARQLAEVFAAAFGDDYDYVESTVTDDYLRDLLSASANIVLVARTETGEVVGGILAYELAKLQGEREIYLYDLAVAEAHRRQGIATQLIATLKDIAVNRGATAVYVQADNEDEPAVALYTKIATSVSPDITHFDLL